MTLMVRAKEMDKDPNKWISRVFYIYRGLSSEYDRKLAEAALGLKHLNDDGAVWYEMMPDDSKRIWRLDYAWMVTIGGWWNKLVVAGLARFEDRTGFENHETPARLCGVLLACKDRMNDPATDAFIGANPVRCVPVPETALELTQAIVSINLFDKSAEMVPSNETPISLNLRIYGSRKRRDVDFAISSSSPVTFWDHLLVKLIDYAEMLRTLYGDPELNEWLLKEIRVHGPAIMNERIPNSMDAYIQARIKSDK